MNRSRQARSRASPRVVRDESRSRWPIPLIPGRRERPVIGSASRLIAQWLLRGYAAFLVAFILGAGWIAMNGRAGGLYEAGGTDSVLSGWLLWGMMMMIPLVGTVGLVVGVLAWLVLRRDGTSAATAGITTGAATAVLVSGLGVWFTGVGEADTVGLLVAMAVSGATVAALTMRDARHIHTPNDPVPPGLALPSIDHIRD